VSPEPKEADPGLNNHHYRAAGPHNQLAGLSTADDRQIMVVNAGADVGAGVGGDAGNSGVGVEETSTQKQGWWG
jgi:hypothetical protein